MSHSQEPVLTPERVAAYERYLAECALDLRRPAALDLSGSGDAAGADAQQTAADPDEVLNTCKWTGLRLFEILQRFLEQPDTPLAPLPYDYARFSAALVHAGVVPVSRLYGDKEYAEQDVTCAVAAFEAWRAAENAHDDPALLLHVMTLEQTTEKELDERVRAMVRARMGASGAAGQG
ncbi:hypothetical protein JCM10449v2_003613 [Rhodotorula kratochvilovae]